jgi:hypothetical protein
MSELRLIHYCEENGALIGDKEFQIIQKQRPQPAPQPAPQSAGQQNKWTPRPSADELASEFVRMGMNDRVSTSTQQQPPKPAENAKPTVLPMSELFSRL